MERRDIPGYYYDQEKKKYFKIQKNSPAGSAYSSQDVKRRKLRDEKNIERAEAEARQQGRIRRGAILQAPLAGHLLHREIGQVPRYRLDGARIYCQGLLPRGRLTRQMPVQGARLFALNHRPDLGQSVVDFNSVNEDQILTFRIDIDKNGGLENCDKFWELYPEMHYPSYLSEVFGNTGPATSLSTHIGSGNMAMTWLSGSTHSGIAIVPKAGGDSITLKSNTSPTIVLGPGVSRGLHADIYSSTPAPSESPLAFAFGSTYGILVLDKHSGDLSWVNFDRFPQHKSPKDVFALEFSADNHNILLSGCRKGILNFTDLRVPTSNSDIINHPSTITHVRQLDKNRVIVAGLNSSLCQYDLRFLGETTNFTSSPQIPNKSFRNRRITSPVVQYPGYHNDSSIHMGFDIDLETGTVAAAQEKDDFNPALRLFSLHGGREVTPLDMPLDFRNGPNIRCIKFFEDIPGRMKSLYIGGKLVQRFAWKDTEEEDP